MSQKEFWNDKFKDDEFFYGINPNEFLASNKDLLKNGGDILLLGEGEGRNALYFAKNGFNVSAIDCSDIGLSKLANKAKEENLNINLFCEDLTTWESNKKYDAVLASYLHMHTNDLEKLFLNIENSLNSGGYFIAEFFSKNQLNYSSGGPKNSDLLYSVEDFEDRFNSCIKDVKEELVVLDEGIGHQGEASVIRVIIKKQ